MCKASTQKSLILARVNWRIYLMATIYVLSLFLVSVFGDTGKLLILVGEVGGISLVYVAPWATYKVVHVDVL